MKPNVLEEEGTFAYCLLCQETWWINYPDQQPTHCPYCGTQEIEY